MTAEQKRMPEYNHYAKKSMVFGIIILCLITGMLWLLGWLNELAVHNNSASTGNIVVIGYPLAIICTIVLSIIGFIFGKRGLKSEKVGMSIFGVAISGVVLLALITFIIWSIIYFATGGEIM